MKIYVAGRTTNIPTVREVQRLLTEVGHEITMDWTRIVEATGAEGRSDSERAINAGLDRDGVFNSDAIVVIMGPQLCGTLIEIGMALGHDIPVILLGKPERDSVFFYMGGVYRLYDDQVGYDAADGAKALLALLDALEADAVEVA